MQRSIGNECASTLVAFNRYLGVAVCWGAPRTIVQADRLMRELDAGSLNELNLKLVT
jgi:hypothetical protein